MVHQARVAADSHGREEKETRPQSTCGQDLLMRNSDFGTGHGARSVWLAELNSPECSWWSWHLKSGEFSYLRDSWDVPHSNFPFTSARILSAKSSVSDSDSA